MAPLNHDPQPPRQPLRPWWYSLLRLLFLGALTGACIGLAHTAASVLVWLLYGQLQFYFHNWPNVLLTCTALTVGGAIAGLPYGFVLWLLETRFSVRVPMLLVLCLLLPIAFLAQLIVAAVDFHRHQNSAWSFATLLGPAFLGLILSLLTALWPIRGARRPGRDRPAQTPP